MSEPPDKAKQPSTPLTLDSPLVIEAFKAADGTARAALQAAVLINGGAALALLSQAKEAKSREDAGAMLLLFGLGVLLAAVGLASRCVAQAHLLDTMVDVSGKVRPFPWEVKPPASWSLIITLLSYVAFAFGLVAASRVLVR